MLRIVLTFVVSLTLLGASSASAQILLQLAGTSQGPIPGDSTDPFLPNTIEVTSFQWGAGRAFDPNGVPSSLSMSEVTISKEQDIASLPIIRANGEGERLQTCRFYFFAASPAAASGDESLSRRMPLPGEYLQIELIGAYITGYSTSAGADGFQSESITISYDSFRALDAATGEIFLFDVRTQTANGLARTVEPKRPVVTPGVFDFEVPDGGRIDVEVVDSRGRFVTRLFGDAAARETGVLHWDATDENGRRLPPGVYTATVRTAELETTRKIVIGD